MGLGACPGLGPVRLGEGGTLPGFGACLRIRAARFSGPPRGSGPARGLQPAGIWGLHWARRRAAAGRGLPGRAGGSGPAPGSGPPAPPRRPGAPSRPLAPRAGPARLASGPERRGRRGPGRAGQGRGGAETGAGAEPERSGAAAGPGRACGGGGVGVGAGRRKMANVGLQFQASAGDADPQSRPLLLLGQLHHLHRVPWSHVRGKLQPRVTEEVSGPRGRPEAPPGTRRGARPALRRLGRGGGASPSPPPGSRLQGAAAAFEGCARPRGGGAGRALPEALPAAPGRAHPVLAARGQAAPTLAF